jgi:hypothetical protein
LLLVSAAAAQEAVSSVDGRVVVAESAGRRRRDHDLAQFRDLAAASLRRDGQGVAVIDPWRLLPVATHVLLGHGLMK